MGVKGPSMAWQPGFGVRAGLPAGMPGRAGAGQRSLILGLAADKGQHAVGWAAFLRSA